MNEKIKIGGIFAIGVIFGFLICYTLPSTRDTTSTISAIKEQQSSVNYQIGNASSGIDNAKNSAERISSTINGVQERLIESERIAIDNSNRVDRCEKIARECLNIAKENGKILSNVGEADKKHTP